MEFFLKAKVKDGELVILNKERVHSFFMKHEGKHFEISVKPLEETMSAGWMRWYRGIAINTIIEGLEKQTGEVYEPDEVHAYNVAKIAKPRIKTREALGETIVETKEFSLAGISKKKWFAFKDALIAFWAARDIEIKEPDEQIFLNDERNYSKIRDFNANRTQED